MKRGKLKDLEVAYCPQCKHETLQIERYEAIRQGLTWLYPYRRCLVCGSHLEEQWVVGQDAE